ncbi:unnamed protein product [Toxocara canis]|uniref:Reverse transcriptase domain-containing protein n=1 Tax=Toxocara canis TaxID=6265 RepID=A0A183UKR8_TOXCA|nr:unnamed protein product [Toxocara canis]
MPHKKLPIYVPITHIPFSKSFDYLRFIKSSASTRCRPQSSDAQICLQDVLISVRNEPIYASESESVRNEQIYASENESVRNDETCGSVGTGGVGRKHKLKEYLILILILIRVTERLLPFLLFKMVVIDVDDLADKLAANLLPQLTSALSDKLLAAVQPAVDRLNKFITIRPEVQVQPPATQNWVEPQLHSVMTKMIHMDRNELDKKNKRAVVIGIPHEATEKDTKEDEKMLREAITACNNRQLSESYANGHITTRRYRDYRAGSKGY